MADNKIKKDPGLKIKVPAGKQEIIITRLFNAPRDLVFKTYNDPSLRASWWGPKDLETKVEKMDARPGGNWRIIQNDSAGNGYAFHGLYHTVLEPERLAFTFEFEGMPGHVSLESLKFEELPGGKTKVTDTTVFQTLEDRNGMVEAGMEKGVVESYTRFAGLLKNICRQRQLACAA